MQNINNIEILSKTMQYKTLLIDAVYRYWQECSSLTGM